MKKTEQLNLFSGPDLEIPKETRSRKDTSRKLTRNSRLTPAYELASAFQYFPQTRAEQKKLIQIYYGGLKLGKNNTVPLKHIPDNQIRGAALNFYTQAHKTMGEKTTEEKSIIKNLFLLEKLLKHDTNQAELFDERVCIQLENIAEDSDLVQEYNAIKGYS